MYSHLCPPPPLSVYELAPCQFSGTFSEREEEEKKEENECTKVPKPGMKDVFFSFHDSGIFMGHYSINGCLMLFAESTHYSHEAHQKLKAAG